MGIHTFLTQTTSVCVSSQNKQKTTLYVSVDEYAFTRVVVHPGLHNRHIHIARYFLQYLRYHRQAPASS
jgi:hypothetical protein